MQENPEKSGQVGNDDRVVVRFSGGGPVRRSGGRFDKGGRPGSSSDFGDRPRKPRQKRKFD